MRTLVLGLGNPLLGDDGVGWRVAQECAAKLGLSGAQSAELQDASHVEFDFHAGGGLSLMERLIGYDRAVIVDAISTRQQPPGSVDFFRLEDLPARAASHLASAHETDLPTALQVGRQMKADLPDEIIIVAVETQNAFDFSEQLSPLIADALPRAVEVTLNQLR